MKKIFCFIICFVFVFSLAACGNAEDESSANSAGKVNVMTHEEYIAAKLDSVVTVETYIQAKQSWWEDKATFYTEASDGAYFIYNMPCTKAEYDKLITGTKIRVTGKKTEYNGEIEITDSEFEMLEGTYIAKPKNLTALIGTDALAEHQNELAAFKNMTIEAKADKDGNKVPFLYNWDGSGKEGDDLYFSASVNGRTVNFTVESYLCGPDTDAYKSVKALKIGGVYDLTGFLYWYNGANPHITAVAPAE